VTSPSINDNSLKVLHLVRDEGVRAAVALRIRVACGKAETISHALFNPAHLPLRRKRAMFSRHRLAPDTFGASRHWRILALALIRWVTTVRTAWRTAGPRYPTTERPPVLATKKPTVTAGPCRRTVGALSACFLFALLPHGAFARPSVAVAAPFEVGDSPAGNYLAALIAGADRDTLAAATFFREALRADPSNAELTERAFVAALANGNIADSFRLADRLITRDPNNGLAHLVFGVRAIKAHQYIGARAQLAKSGLGSQRDLTATLLSAWSYVGSGDAKRALELTDRLKDDSFIVFRDYHAGLIADLVNNPAEALKRLQSSFKADRNSLRLVDAYARYLARHGRIEEAKTAYEEYDRTNPRHPIVAHALADLAAGKPLTPMIGDAEDGAAEVLYGLGAAGARQGDELAAMIYLRLSLFLQPTNDLAIVTLGDLYERLKQNERAIDIYESIADTSPMRPMADIQVGLVLDSLGRTDEAVKHLKEIVTERPRDLDAVTTLGKLESSTKNYADAAASYSKALDIIGTATRADWSLFYFRAIAYERQKQWPAAEADFKKALELYPEQPQVLNYLGYSWVDMGSNLDEAFKMLHRAVELRPDDGYIVDSLGWAHFKLGHYEEATKELERAIDLKPSDPVINDHLGDAYWKVGRKLEAQFQWNHARDLKPEPEDLAKILKKINTGLEDEKPASAATDPKKDGG
jgi:tetratricopeptide (TPR) repeat protein